MMTKEEKQLLLKDLCARLSCGVKFILSGGNVNNIYIMKGIDLIVTDEGDWKYAVTAKSIEPIEIEYIKPYLRPLENMTEEEEEEYWNIVNLKSPEMPVGEIPSIETIAQCSIIILDWLLSKGFDIRGLIPMELALEAPEGMYKL